MVIYIPYRPEISETVANSQRKRKAYGSGTRRGSGQDPDRRAGQAVGEIGYGASFIEFFGEEASETGKEFCVNPSLRKRTFTGSTEVGASCRVRWLIRS